MTRVPDPNGQLAQALAYAFLAAPTWDRAGLTVMARRVVRRRCRWFRPVVAGVLAGHPRRPADQPRDLAAVIAGVPALVRAVERGHRGGRPLRVRRVAAVPATMGVARWTVPPLDHHGDVARLLEVPAEQLPWLADQPARLRRTPPGPYHLYRYSWVVRPGAVPRLLEAPTPLLRQVLRRVLHTVLDRVPSHDAAYGFVPGRSAVDNARRHLGAQLLVTMDLQHFFTAVTRARVRGLFRTFGYPEPVADLLSALVTQQTPVWVLSAMPPGGDSSARHRFRAWLRSSHLSQGAPTSPALANLVCFRLDARLSGYARAVGATYTRYADDLTFSWPAGSKTPAPAAVVSDVSRMVAGEGFRVNAAKTRSARSSHQQLVTGIVVNQTLNYPRRDYDRLRAVLHQARTDGAEMANRSGHPDFRAHLDGRISWVESLNPGRGARLRAEFSRIAWPEQS